MQLKNFLAALGLVASALSSPTTSNVQPGALPNEVDNSETTTGNASFRGAGNIAWALTPFPQANCKPNGTGKPGFTGNGSHSGCIDVEFYTGGELALSVFINTTECLYRLYEDTKCRNYVATVGGENSASLSSYCADSPNPYQSFNVLC